MKRLVLLFALFAVLFTFATPAFATGCIHSNGAAALCTNCYNQAVSGYTVQYGAPAIQQTTTYQAAAPVASYGDAESVTTTTVTERVIQTPPPAQAGLIVKTETITPQTTYLVPATTSYGSYSNFGTVYGNQVSGFFGATQNYGNFGNFGNYHHVSGNFGNFRGNGHNGNFGNFRGNFNANFRSGHGNQNFGGNRNFNARGQQVNGNGRVQALPRVRNAVNALRGR